MNILIDLIHPAHVHFFRPAIMQLQRGGYRVIVTAREKDVTIDLLKEFGIPYTILSRVGRGRWGLLKELFARDGRLWRFARHQDIDILTGISGVFIAHVGRMLGKPSIVWDDTEHQHWAHKITWPFASSIQSPDCYLNPPHKRQHFYAGCHELAYLHPHHFLPDPAVVRKLGIDPEEKYVIIRMVSWGAHHDIGQHGLADSKKISFVQSIAKFARPYITAEGDLPAALESYRLRIPVHQFHHVLAFASLCIAEGATVASEACVLGVPTVYINTLKLGYIDMMEKYGLLKQTTDTDQALQYSLEWLQNPENLQRCRKGHKKLLQDKIDVTEYIIKVLTKTEPAAR